MKQENMQERDRMDADTFEIMDRLKDKNKEELTKIIEDGMQHKADLTMAVD